MMIFAGILIAIIAFAIKFYPRTPKSPAGAIAPPAVAAAPTGTTTTTSAPSKSVPVWKFFWIMLAIMVITGAIAPALADRISGRPHGAEEIIDWSNKKDRPNVVIVQPTPTVVASTPGDDLRWGTNYLSPGKKYYFDRLVTFYIFGVREADFGSRIRFQKEGHETSVYWDLALLEKRNSRKENDHDNHRVDGRFYFTVATPVMVTITQHWQ